MMTDYNDEQVKEAFCLAHCEGRIPRNTCTSLGTCDEYDRFCKYLNENRARKYAKEINEEKQNKKILQNHI